MAADAEHPVRPRSIFWSREAYRRAASASVPSMLWYLAGLITLTAIVVTFAVQPVLVQRLDQLEAWMLRYLPEFSIHHGVVTSAVPQPYVVKTKELVFTLDTTGQTTEVDPTYPYAVLLTRQQLVVRSPDGIDQRDMSQLDGLVVDAPMIERVTEGLRSWIWVIVGLAAGIVLAAVRLGQILLGTLLMLLVSALLHRRLRYAALFNLGVYALTVPTLLDLLGVGSLGFPYAWWLSCGVYAGYLIWAVLAQPVPAREIAPSA